MRRKCVEVTLIVQDANGNPKRGNVMRYVGDPLKGYNLVRKNGGHKTIYCSHIYLSSSMLHDFSKMKQYEVRYLTDEEFFMESL